MIGGPGRLMDPRALEVVLTKLNGHHEADTEAVTEHICGLEHLLQRAGACLAIPGCPGREALAAEIASVVRAGVCP